MNIENSIIHIHLFDPIGKSSFPLKDAIIIKDIESLTIQDSCVKLSSVINIVVPFAVGFLFHNDVGYKYIKIIQKEKPTETNTNPREECIWWGKVNTIGMQSNIKDNTINIIGMSFADTYNYVTVDHQSYKNTTLQKIFELNSQIICNDATHGAKSSVMSMSDIVFVPKKGDYNPIIDSFVRPLGDTSTNVLRTLLAKGSLYIFSTMYKGRPKIIVNTLPIVPDGEYGFDEGASYLVKNDPLSNPLKYFCGLNEIARCNENNVKSISFTGDYTFYRDRMRMFVDNNEEHWSPNPALELCPTDRITKNNIKLPLAPWVPLVINRGNLSKKEANHISQAIWNNINIQSPSFHLEIVGWELFGVPIEVGRIIIFSFKASNPYIDPTNSNQNQTIGFNLKDEPMIITECVKKYSQRGFTASITLVQKDSFLNEKINSKKRMFKEAKSSYYTGYEGAANDKI